MKRPIKIEFSDQELNYIDAALRADVRRMQSDSFHTDANVGGNGPYLLRYQSRLQKRLSRLHSVSYRKRMGEKKWKASRKFINRMIRESRHP